MRAWETFKMFQRQAPCVVCLSSCSNYVFAVVSPWIRELGIRAIASKYYICEVCNSGQFSKRYNKKQMEAIYRDYRGGHYLSIRKNWEPWYSTEYNSNHDSKSWIENRKDALTGFLVSCDLKNLTTIIDIGGDRGQYIPDISTNKIVLDISDKETLSGVTRIAEFHDLPNADLIIYAHVLEHVAEPFSELKNLFLKSKYVYVEVPFGVPIINKHRRKKFNFIYHLLSSANKSLWRRNTSPSTGRDVPAKKMLTQSEHLTFFTEKSMQVLAERLGATVVIQKKSISTPDLSTGVVLQCLYSLAILESTLQHEFE
jgi:hypothetical protein